MRRGVFSLLVAAVLSVATLPLARAAGTPVDLELILAVDVSRSMDLDEQQLQRDGYVAGIAHPDVVSAIAQGLHGRIALTYVEWARPSIQATVIGWRLPRVKHRGAA